MKKIFEGQVEHFVFLLLLLIATMKLFALFPLALSGKLFGFSTYNYIVLGLFIPVLHQVYVWLVWRLELHYNLLTSYLGKHAFLLFKLDFSFLFISRPISLFLLSLANKNTLSISTGISVLLSLLLLIPLVYLIYSIVKYFGFERAMGKDHFDRQWAKDQPLIREGIFKVSPNAMYVFGFLTLYIIALLFRSQAGLIVAIFNHLYIWLHYYFTERIDMRIIYDNRKSSK